MKNTITLINPTEDQKRNLIILNQIAEDLARKSTELTEKEERLNAMIASFDFLNEESLF